MENKHQETLLQTIKCHLVRNEKTGTVEWVPDESGPWEILKQPPTSGLIRYFTPAYTFGIDEYGVPYP